MQWILGDFGMKHFVLNGNFVYRQSDNPDSSISDIRFTLPVIWVIKNPPMYLSVNKVDGINTIPKWAYSEFTMKQRHIV